MPLPEQAYTDETERHEDGLDYVVIDTSKLDFTGPNATWGKKVAPTRVRLGRKDDVIETRHGNFVETPPYTVQKDGELIFINPKPDGSLDIYAPTDAQEVLARDYKFIGGDVRSEDGATYLPTGRPVRLLKEAVDRRSVVRDAHAPGRHAFLRPGDTLKLDDGRVTGIERRMFKLTWVETDADGNELKKKTNDRNR